MANEEVEINNRKVKICIEKDGDEYYVFCPSIKGIHTCGDTEEDAIDNIKNALTAYFISEGM